MAAELGENAIDIALKVARALTEVGAEYFLGSGHKMDQTYLTSWASRLHVTDLLERARS